MKLKRLQGAAVLAALVALATPAGASRFGRVGLDFLVAENETVVIGEVLETHSYWNKGATLILTDAKVAVTEVLKGDPKLKEITVTLLGGTIGDRTNVAVGAARLEPNTSYLLFLHRADLPGAANVQMIREHNQGVFEIQIGEGGLRAVSQARTEPLAPDASGATEAPGGKKGLLLGSMQQTVRELVDRGARKEVKR